jgi:hypothetical protein
MTLAQNYWLLFKLRLARWHDRRYPELVDDVEEAVRDAGFKI